MEVAAKQVLGKRLEEIAEITFWAIANHITKATHYLAYSALVSGIQSAFGEGQQLWLNLVFR